MNRRGIFLSRTIAVILVLASGSLMSGCLENLAGKENNATKAVLPNSLAGKDGFNKTLYPYVRSKCAQCHGASQIPLFASSHLDTAYQLAYGLVNFVEVPASKFVAKIKDGHCGGNCTTDGSDMIAMLNDWKSYYSGKLAGEAVDRGNFFTAAIPIPPKPATCKPSGSDAAHNLAGSPDDTTATDVDLVGGGSATVVHSDCWIKMTFPLSDVTPPVEAALQRAIFTVDIAYENDDSTLGDASYTFKNPRIISPDADIYIHAIKTFINGAYHEQYGVVYQDIDMIVSKADFPPQCGSNFPPAAPTPIYPLPAGCVPTVPPLYSTAASATGILSEKHVGLGYQSDTLAFSFEYIKVGITSPCQNMQFFDTYIYQPIKSGTQLGCLNCHCSTHCTGAQTGSSLVTLAGERFNMADQDAINNQKGDPLQGEDKVCQRFLQRSNLTRPELSPIIVQPSKGMNGMPAQPNFVADYMGCWVKWIQSEACYLANPNLSSAARDSKCKVVYDTTCFP